ncbi:MAG TPA: hypothetical protein VEH82_10960 [Acidimicrobiales bacterium]|nr:hypothetical protein [Acidimicrobiales bacterium]
MTGPSEAMEAMAERLEAVAEELGDMALDALRRAGSGDPDSAETGRALAQERRLLQARRAVEKSVAALRQGSAGAAFDDGAA